MIKAYVLLADIKSHDLKEVKSYEGVIFQDFEHMDDELQDRDFEVMAIEDFCLAINEGEIFFGYWVSYVYVVYEG